MVRKTRNREPLIDRIYDYIKRKKNVTMQELYARFPKERKSNIRRALHFLKKDTEIIRVDEWRIN